MKNFRIRILKAVTALALIAAVAAGMTAALGKKADAGNIPGAYTVTFYANGPGIKVVNYNGQKDTEIAVQVAGGSYTTNLRAEKDCCGSRFFLGWSTSKGSTKIAYPAGTPIRVTGNMKLYAVFKTVHLSYYLCTDGYFKDANGKKITDGCGVITKQIHYYGVCPCTKLLSSKRVYLTRVNFKGWLSTNTGDPDYRYLFTSDHSIQDVLNKICRPNDTDLYLTCTW